MKQYAAQMNRTDIAKLIADFDENRRLNKDTSTDQLLNAIFLTVAMRDARERKFDIDELCKLRTALMQPLSGSNE